MTKHRRENRRKIFLTQNNLSIILLWFKKLVFSHKSIHIPSLISRYCFTIDMDNLKDFEKKCGRNNFIFLNQSLTCKSKEFKIRFSSESVRSSRTRATTQTQCEWGFSLLNYFNNKHLTIQIIVIEFDRNNGADYTKIYSWSSIYNQQVIHSWLVKIYICI